MKGRKQNENNSVGTIDSTAIVRKAFTVKANHNEVYNQVVVFANSSKKIKSMNNLINWLIFWYYNEVVVPQQQLPENSKVDLDEWIKEDKIEEDI